MSARKRSREKSGFRGVLLLIIGGLVLAGGVYFIVFSDFFKIREIEIVGNEYLTGGELGLSPGGNILFWKPNIELVKFPRVSGFGIKKKYFERKVIINFESRDRYVIWCLEDKNECFWVDKSGIVFSGAPDLKGPLIFRLIRDGSGRNLSLGDKALDDELFPNLVATFDFLDEIDVGVRDFRIDDLKFKEATARIENGPDIYFSLTLDPHFGLGVVKSLRQSGEWDIIKYLDLRVSNRAYYSG
jgi:hypothetical protein